MRRSDPAAAGMDAHAGGHDHPHEHHHHDHLHDHEHGHGHGLEHEHGHGHGHGHGHQHGHGHGHEHGGVRGFLYETFVPHSHDAADRIDDALEGSAEGIRAVRISLVLMLATAVVQAAVVVVSGSVALLADTIHNFSDALTAVPLWIAFALSRRAPTRRFSYGLGRSEDLAGLFIVGVIVASAVVAAWQSIDRLIHPHPLENLGWIAAAGMVGFLGNELVARYRLGVGRRIGSAALEADGVHARTDGFTSLAVVFGALGAWLGFPLADPIVGLLISVMIVAMLWRTAQDIGLRLMDGTDPDLTDEVLGALVALPGVTGVHDLRIRAMGHAHLMEVTLDVPGHLTMAEAEDVRARAEAVARERVPRLDGLTLSCHAEHVGR
ncbi:cation diffusion facilitator family transporter [Raineyella fluvialis]|uniref:cation diffusion facilitator family transporter n=1 Tax=Raineyella fluvialis TaxID=2662261 RepID=UPI001E4DFDF5|nr:cation diffusion facilitator family transporter [Raineyella fluvialis]